MNHYRQPISETVRCERLNFAFRHLGTWNPVKLLNSEPKVARNAC